MNRDEQEMALWREAYNASMLLPGDGRNAEADAAVEAFRRRYPPQPAAPPAVWYDEPPFAGEYHVEGLPCVCWVDEDVVWCPTWDREGERPRLVEMPRNGRRVSHVTKPKEPQPTASPAVWYDEPPFEKDGSHHPCWVAGIDAPQTVYWSVANRGWRHGSLNVSGPYPLAWRRVSPITKPQEPTP